jgi:hypothetical protein
MKRPGQEINTREERMGVKERLGSLKSEITKEKTTSVLRSAILFEKELFFSTVRGLQTLALEIRKPFQVLLGHLSLMQLAFLGFCLGGLVVGFCPGFSTGLFFNRKRLSMLDLRPKCSLCFQR